MSQDLCSKLLFHYFSINFEINNFQSVVSSNLGLSQSYPIFFMRKNVLDLIFNINDDHYLIAQIFNI